MSTESRSHWLVSEAFNIGCYLNLSNLKSFMLVSKSIYDELNAPSSDDKLWKFHYERLSVLDKKISGSLRSSSNSDEKLFKIKLQKLVLSIKFDKMKSIFSSKKGQYILLQDVEFPSNSNSLERNSLQLVDHLNNFLYFNNKNKGHGDRILKCFITIVRALVAMSEYHDSQKLITIYQKVVNKFVSLFSADFYGSIVDFTPKHKLKSATKAKALSQVIELEKKIGSEVIEALLPLEESVSALNNYKAVLFVNFLELAQQNCEQEIIESCLLNVIQRWKKNSNTTLKIVKDKISIDHPQVIRNEFEWCHHKSHGEPLCSTFLKAITRSSDASHLFNKYTSTHSSLDRILSRSTRNTDSNNNIHLVHNIDDDFIDLSHDILSDFAFTDSANSKHTIEKVLSVHNKYYNNDQLTLSNNHHRKSSTMSSTNDGSSSLPTTTTSTFKEESDHIQQQQQQPTPLPIVNEIPQQFILKFKESVKLTEKMKQEFEKSTSIQLLQYIPDHSYLIYVTPSQLNQLIAQSQQQSFSKGVSMIISKVIPLSPSMKINPTLKHDMENERIIRVPCQNGKGHVGGNGGGVIGGSIGGGSLIHIASSLVPYPYLTNQDTREIAQQIRQVCERQHHMNVRFVRLISNRKIMLSVQLCSRSELNTLIDVLSHHPAVNWIERFDMERDGFMPENYHARLLIQGGKRALVTGTTLNSADQVADGPFHAVGLTGKNQTVAISDSGLDVDHCFFYDPQVKVPVILSSNALLKESKRNGQHHSQIVNDLDVLIQKLQKSTTTTSTTGTTTNTGGSITGKEHRKIKAYVAFMDSKDGGHGHGSHTSGILTGQCLYPKSNICRHNGLAHDAKLVFFDVGCDLDGGCSCDSFDACPCYMYPDSKCPGGNKLVTPIDLYSGMFEPQYALGARISSNSLGGAIGYGYTQSTAEIDKFQYDHDDFLVVWSAGNSGHKGYMTLTGPTKQAKNSLIVGASTNVLESWQEALQLRNYTERALFLRKKFSKKFSCTCEASGKKKSGSNKSVVNNQVVEFNTFSASWCHFDACRKIEKLTSEEACETFMGGEKCQFPKKYKISLMKKKANFNVAFACSQKCALKNLHLPEMRSLFDSENLADFSSLGPALDGRIKPDVVSPGYFVISTQSHFGDAKGKCSLENSNDVKFNLKEMAGTSMSTPLVAAAATIVRQYFTDGFYPSGKRPSNAQELAKSEYTNPSAALIKAILISSARGMKGLARAKDYFDHFNPKHRTIFEGFGLINLSNTLKLAPESGVGQATTTSTSTTMDLFVVDRQEITTDLVHSYNFIVVDNSTDLSITLVWTDYPASPMASLALVNDLDLKLEYELDNGDIQTFYGNHFANNNQPDRVNNVEKILIPSPPLRTALTVSVKGHNIPHGPQRYSMVINGKKISKASVIKRSLDVTDVSPSNTIMFFNWQFALIITCMGTALLVSLAVNIGLCLYARIQKRDFTKQFMNMDKMKTVY
ncbi:hypothetical protein C9374_006736 [Naegleria lovaniensis]|uniref:Peptidase S8/S53 domain-containing protein n=1 Tax=Naegleria lovaniensis TaxID=51637 RepID=A0AA88KM89_NAELO|nr:uncharacterized protein C9374_006736 [Naegleria lovaniensis]KAG2379619.1 hypothetical protein C9374_006736 [Naegleria lovaniensis]